MKYLQWSFVFALILVGCMPSESAIQTAISQTQTAFPTETVAPTRAITPTATPLPEEIIDAKGVVMRLIPADIFVMGADRGFDNEGPAHFLFLDNYYIDKYEITNAFYKVCVDAGSCVPPKKASSSTRARYYGNPEFDDYPVIYVDFESAQTYCSWREAGLPTEAQWEKAARGTDGRTYPWGDGIDQTFANYNSYLGDTTMIGSYGDGNSFYGVYDMSGNVWEWVADWYSETYYQDSPSFNPSGPDSGNHRILRGGSWSNADYFVRSSFRTHVLPGYAYYSTGFRCAREASP